MDEPDEKFIISWVLLTYGLFDSNADNCPVSNQCLTTFTITDDDPTVVSIARVGSGAVTEGQKIEFTVTLGRALVAGETIDVPLSISGTNVTTGDWSLALKPGATNTGVARRIGNVVRFSGAGARTATLELTAANDSTADHNETFNIALGTNTDFDDTSLATNVGGGADPHNSNNAFSVTVNEPPPSVSLHATDAVGREGGSGTASVELRLRRALDSGETLTVTYSLDMQAGASESHHGVTLSHTAGATSTGTVTITGPNAPKNIRLRLNPAAYKVNPWVTGVEVAEFRLTGVSGLAGAGVSGADSAKIFVNEGGASRTTSMQVSGGRPPTASRYVEEGSLLTILLDGKAGRKLNSGPRPYDWYNVTVGVQNLTTDFDDLGRGYRGPDTIGGWLRREGDTDYYNVGVLGTGRSGELVIPIQSDGANEGDERFRVFIAGTPGSQVRASYIGVTGTYNSLRSAPGVDFIIKGQPGGPMRAEAPPAPTQAVSNVQVTAVDAANARVTWDAVPHATSYQVVYETTSTLVDELNRVQGAAFGLTGTELTFQHDAAEAMTLTVTVTPAYEDENGDTQHLNGLASSATIEVGPPAGDDSVNDGGAPPDDDDAAPSCVSDAKWSTVAGYYASNRNRAPNYGANWYRVLIAYQQERTDKELPDWVGATAKPTEPYTVKEAEDGEDAWSGWTPVREVLECLDDRGLLPDPPPAPAPACVSDAKWSTVAGYYASNRNRAPNYGANWYRVLIAYQQERTDKELPDWVGATAKPTEAYTVKEAEDGEEVWSGWTPVREVLECLRDAAAQSSVPLLPGGWDPLREGVVQFVNHSAEAGEVRIVAIDDSGWSPEAVTPQLAPGEPVQLTTRDLEQGAVAKGLLGYIGAGSGNWRLDTSSEQDVEVRAYVRSRDGLLAPVDEIVEPVDGVRHVPTFHPADNRDRFTSLLRLVNRGEEALVARIAGTDDAGAPGDEVTLVIPAREAVLLSAADLEGGGVPGDGQSLHGALGDGRGMWRLRIVSDGDLEAMSLLESPDGHLVNLSGGGWSLAPRSRGVRAVPYFPSSSDALGRQGFLRIVNHSPVETTVRVEPRDRTERRYEPLTLVLGPGEAAHLDSRDLELGNAAGGLVGSTGAGTGDWRLDILSEPGVEVLPYVREPGGSLLPMHHVAGEAGGGGAGGGGARRVDGGSAVSR